MANNSLRVSTFPGSHLILLGGRPVVTPSGPVLRTSAGPVRRSILSWGPSWAALAVAAGRPVEIVQLRRAGLMPPALRLGVTKSEPCRAADSIRPLRGACHVQAFARPAPTLFRYATRHATPLVGTLSNERDGPGDVPQLSRDCRGVKARPAACHCEEEPRRGV